MPLATGHGLAGLMTAYYFKQDRIQSWKAGLCILAANLPDLDYIPGLLIGAPKYFHPSFTHSFFAAIIFSFIVYYILKYLTPHDCRRWALAFGIAYISHIFLDIIQVDNYTANGIGIPLFFPFTNQCYQTDWQWIPSTSSFIDFSSFASVLRCIFNPKSLGYLLHEQLVIGTIIGFLFGARRIWNRKLTRLQIKKK
jgi:membrane-bound metal-dependent hydrolase YbcI (DUF457 family)